MHKKRMAWMLCLVMLLAAFAPLAASAEAVDPLVVTVFIGDPFDQPTSDNKIYKLIEEELGITFEFEFLAGDLDETLGIKIAGEDYADLICGSNSAEKLIDAGAYIDLMEYIDPESTPNLWAHYEPYFKRVQMPDGGFYVMANYGRIYNDPIVNYINGPAFWLQKKVLEWDGYPTITTLDQYFDLIARYAEAHPTTDEGLPTSGFEILCDGWRNFCLLNPVQHLIGHPNDGGVFVHWDDNYRVDVFHNKDYSKTYYQKLNEVFNAGLIEQDTFVQNFDQYIAKLSSGRVLGMFDQYWNFQNATDALVAAQKYEDTYIGLPLVYDESITEHYLDQTIININRGFGISVNCKNPERLVQMFETFLSDRWQTIFHWGIEGEDYYVDENGRYLRTDEQKANADDPIWVNANKAKQLFYNAPKKEGTMDNGNSWDPGLQPEMYFDKMSEYDKNFLTQYGMNTPAEFANPAPPNQPYYAAWQIDLSAYPDILDIGTKLVDIQARDLPQIIMSKPEEFEQKWEAFSATHQAAGQAEYEEFMQGIILEMNERLR
ncbi:MAG: sugar ABC transporter substrate-binding protein [Oscillospiraceae bacterium]|jgi:putative aldouronate transport system substrate-binding protein|nr:sugar ABC transporter substrate-binding protein [Oscillospiraceae bacterium]